MDRFVLTGARWAKIEPLCPGKKTDRGGNGKDNRLFIEAVLWIALTGSPWRDYRRIPGTGTRFTRATATEQNPGVFQKIFEAVSDDADMEYAMIDDTVIRVHRHGQGGGNFSPGSERRPLPRPFPERLCSPHERDEEAHGSMRPRTLSFRTNW
ncbi:transposase [Acetobacter fallax]